MKNNKGITMITLVITIVVLLILAGISIGTGNNLIEKSELENLKTNMMLIKVKGKEYVENANFKLGTNIENATDKEDRITTAKGELNGKLNGELTDKSILEGKMQSTEDNEYTYYYKLSTESLKNIGITKVDSDEENGWYIIRYDVQNIEVEIYNTKGFENEGTTYYSLTDIENIQI